MEFYLDNSRWDEYLDPNQTAFQSPQQRATQAGIYRPEGGPAGGYAMAPQTYTGHTGFRENRFGANKGERVGTGGGQLVTTAVPESELLLARPDLTGAKQFAQFDSTVDTSKVTPVVRAQALRSMGTGE